MSRLSPDPSVQDTQERGAVMNYKPEGEVKLKGR